MVSGPRILNTVRIPSSLRIPPTYFMEVWYFWANMKQIPTSSSSLLHRSGSCAMFTPRASRQSAVPLRELAARFPCLATFTPPAARIKAEVVEILKVWALSPPVPTISSTSMPGCSSWTAFWRMAAAQPEISSIVSAPVLFVLRAARKAAFCVAEVSPLIISVITVNASS